MKKWSYLVLLFTVPLFEACTPNAPTPSSELTQDYVLERIMEYYPYSANGHYVYVNVQSGQQWVIYPFTGGNGNNQFPDVISESYFEGVPQWENLIIAEFNTENYDNVYRTSQLMSIGTRSDGAFEVHVQCKIRMGKDEGYGGSYHNVKADTVSVRALLTDTITLPITSIYDSRNSGHSYERENVYIQLVRGKGLYEFCLDGQSVWRRVEK